MPPKKCRKCLTADQIQTLLFESDSENSAFGELSSSDDSYFEQSDDDLPHLPTPNRTQVRGRAHSRSRGRLSVNETHGT